MLESGGRELGCRWGRKMNAEVFSILLLNMWLSFLLCETSQLLELGALMVCSSAPEVSFFPGPFYKEGHPLLLL